MTSLQEVRPLIVTLFVAALPFVAAAQLPSSPQPPKDNATDAEIIAASRAIEIADGYSDLLQAIERHEAVLASRRMVQLADRALLDQSLDANRRGMLILERQLSIDCRERGGRTAARLLGVRLVAGYAMLANSPAEFAGVLEKFAPLAREIDVPMVRDALNTPGNTWPPKLLPLMEQLARDWPKSGALAAATRMAQSAEAAGTQPSQPPPAQQSAQGLAGHWRNTRIVFDSPIDDHLVLQPDGRAETWRVTASGREPAKRGRWTSAGNALTVNWDDGDRWAQPFTFYNGQLVLPNIPNRRQFWERIQ